jgi:hypothetical protein
MITLTREVTLLLIERVKDTDIRIMICTSLIKTEISIDRYNQNLTLCRGIINQKTIKRSIREVDLCSLSNSTINRSKIRMFSRSFHRIANQQQINMDHRPPRSHSFTRKGVILELRTKEIRFLQLGISHHRGISLLQDMQLSKSTDLHRGSKEMAMHHNHLTFWVAMFQG